MYMYVQVIASMKLCVWCSVYFEVAKIIGWHALPVCFGIVHVWKMNMSYHGDFS